MKILWVNTHFLHPTTRGGSIRTLEMLKWLNRWHDVHYLALEKPTATEGMARAGEYCAKAFRIDHEAPPRLSPRFLMQAVGNLLSPLPLAVTRYVSAPLLARMRELHRQERYDRIVADFLFSAPNVDPLAKCILFQHNVETMIWQRHAGTAANAAGRWFFGQQARRMERYEHQACREAGSVIAVSAEDAGRMREMFDLPRVDWVPTGVNLEYFDPPPAQDTAVPAPQPELVFVGSMDWLPNIDGIRWFAQEVWPLIRERQPQVRLAIVGRMPPAEITALAERDPRITVTGTVPDVRPYFWGGQVSVVPLRIGGGTRLKIFEAIGAKIPVVSTTIGAEGLPLVPGEHIAIGDTPADFAARCLELLADGAARQRMAAAAWSLAHENYSWEKVTRRFEQLLEQGPAAA